MNILILFCGTYPGFRAAHKRVQNYKKGLEFHGNKVEVLAVCNARARFVFDVLRCLFFNKKQLEILFVYGFGWIGKLLIVILGKIRKIKTVFEINEKPYSDIGSRRDFFLRFFRPIDNWFLTRLVFPWADGFVVISENLRLFVSKYKSGKSLLIKIPILVDYDLYQQPVQGEGGVQPYVFHSATINDQKDGISEVVEALGLVIKNAGFPVHFYLTSAAAFPSTKSKINGIIKSYEIENFVHILGDLDDGTLRLYQHRCAAVVINKTKSEQNRYNFASKIGEYSALGKPIITTQTGEVSSYFKDNFSCFFVPHNDPKAIAKKLSYVLNNPEESSKIGEEAKKLALNEFDYKHNCKKLDLFFHSILTHYSLG